MKIYCDFFLTLLRENVFFCRAAQVTATQKKIGFSSAVERMAVNH